MQASVTDETCNWGKWRVFPILDPMIMNGAIQQMLWHIERLPQKMFGMKNMATMAKYIARLMRSDTDMPWSVWKKKSTFRTPPATMKPATIAATHGTHMTHFI